VVPPPHSSSSWSSVAGSKPAQVSIVFHHKDDDYFWLGFQEYLSKTCNRNTTERIRLFYAKKFVSVLTNGDAQDLLTIESAEKRLNVMKSLTVLSKYLGCYDRWQAMRQQYLLRWSTGNESLQSFERFFNDELNYDAKLQQIKEMIDVLPVAYGNVVKFACLTGLRPTEAVESVKLINDKDKFKEYYKPERQALEHFRFPDVFFRQIKKAYISFVTPDILQIAKSVGATTKISYNAIRLACRKRGINMDMRFCRKIFASHLRQSGIESEIVDLLQGRVPRTVFARHYFTPSLDYRQKVLCALDKLQRDIEER
jgi:hypothetical protein